MPLYEYLCESCGERTEMLRRFRFSLPAKYPDPPSIIHFPFAKLTDDLPLVLEPLGRA